MTRDDLLSELAEKCPAWATGTVILKDESGNIAGYGWIERSTGRVVITSEPKGVKFLSV